MPIIPQHATATSNGAGNAVFTFPDVPQGQLWCGTTTIPGVPSTAVGMVRSSGELLGDIYGPGSYGPWIATETRRLTITMTGLAPNTQYQAVWHADSEGQATSVYPAPITPTVVAAGGTVVVANFPAVQTVDGTVDVGNFPGPPQAGGVESGQLAVDASPTGFPPNPAVVGVVFSAPTSNAHPVYIGGGGVSTGTGLILSPGQVTPVLPVTDSSDLSAVGTSGDVVSFLVI
jgi:hypothetical protein